MSFEDDPKPEAFHTLAARLHTAGIDERAYAAEREARLALMKADNPNLMTLAEIAELEENSDAQQARMDREYAKIKAEADAVAKAKQEAQTSLTNDHFPAPPMKET